MQFNQLYVFGDGLSDMGRWAKLTDFKYPPASLGFYESRWTNGLTWIEHVANALDLPVSMENNFAMGGATTGRFNINEPLRSLFQLPDDLVLPGMLAQVEIFLHDHRIVPENALCFLWAGGHDIGNYLSYGYPDLAMEPPAKNYSLAIEKLTAAGVRHILVVTMPDMGYTPEYFGTQKQVPASVLCCALNEGLYRLKDSYAGSGVNVLVFDGAAVFADVGQHPENYGIKYLEPYLPFEVIDFSEPLKEFEGVIKNRDQGLEPDLFMNWWAVSASARLHEIIAAAAMEFIRLHV